MEKESNVFAYCLDGSSCGDNDIYVMINGSDAGRCFHFHAGAPSDWQSIADTSLHQSFDVCSLDEGPSGIANGYMVAERSIRIYISRDSETQASKPIVQ